MGWILQIKYAELVLLVNKCCPYDMLNYLRELKQTYEYKLRSRH